MALVQWLVRKSKLALMVIGAILFIGLGIGANDEQIPPSTVVLANDSARLYFAPPCVHPREAALLRRTSLAAVENLKYKLDDDCRNSGAFSKADVSATQLLLINLGVLSPPKRWWNVP
jgi:hypothetical protein